LYRQIIVRRLFVLLVAFGLTACQPPLEDWDDIPRTPNAIVVENAFEQNKRVVQLSVERKLTVINRRTEMLAVGETWQQHLLWRNQNVGFLDPVSERIPEPDAPVLVQEYSRLTRTLFVVAAPDETGERLIVVTVLMKPND
jgi:hypothetical protein